MPVPSPTRAERIADGAVHVLGVVFAAAAIAWLLGRASGQAGWGLWTALAIYSAALLAMLSASGAYNILFGKTARPLLRRLDHAAIYVKIAGTFTPLAVILGTAFGYAVLGLVWALAITGAATKLLAARGRMPTGVWPYLALGWLGLALFVPLAGLLPGGSLQLIALGGLLYSAGVVFYRWEALRFATAIWHSFVLVASGCFFAGISGAIAAVP
ncbi:PAQR family membrane homeostasis protein TrhA [Roseovarius sp. Pro17]|uniref:PAQR family membrane homeostasis protein TrhA n=1 Tax=Roseovarius sp. Pro17 TaxID=3108175 RepID=UPI002D78D79A|nr:hemolysin III family protein [Roseovarius sp. Pro17]